MKNTNYIVQYKRQVSRKRGNNDINNNDNNNNVFFKRKQGIIIYIIHVLQCYISVTL